MGPEMIDVLRDYPMDTKKQPMADGFIRAHWAPRTGSPRSTVPSASDDRECAEQPERAGVEVGSGHPPLDEHPGRGSNPVSSTKKSWSERVGGLARSPLARSRHPGSTGFCAASTSQGWAVNPRRNRCRRRVSPVARTPGQPARHRVEYPAGSGESRAYRGPVSRPGRVEVTRILPRGFRNARHEGASH